MIDADPRVERVERFIRARRLLRPGPLVVAVSGGQDSLCMLDVLRRLAPRLGLDLRVAHLNHYFRGAQAQEEAEFVRRVAVDWGLPAEVGEIDVPAYRGAHRLSKQVAARYARYQFLARVAERHGASCVAVGHTADDSAETMLLNLLRGAGLGGLRGLVPARQMQAGQIGPNLDGRHWLSPELPSIHGPLPTVVRPVLLLSRAETEAYCRARGLSFKVDPSNQDTTYRRNWIRGELIPMLEDRIPGVARRLSDTADLLADDWAIVSGAVDQLWGDLAKANEGWIEIDLSRWTAVGEPLQRYLLRRAVDEVAGSLEEIGRVHLDAALALIQDGRVGSRVDLPGGIYLEKGYNSFRLVQLKTPAREAPALPGDGLLLMVPGTVELPSGQIEAQLEERAAVDMPASSVPTNPFEAYLDSDITGPTLVVRPRRPGDRFVPLGMSGPKKLQDFFVDRKVPRRDRDAVPIVATRDDVVWVVGHRIDDRFKVTSSTRRILILRYWGQGTGER